MQNIVLTIGGLLKSFGWSDLFFFVVTLLLVILLVYVIYLVKMDDLETMIMEEPKKREEKRESKPLSKIVSELETNYNPKPIDLSDYEKEMEDTAIISYEELRSRASNSIYYEDDYDAGFDDVLVQKIDKNESNTQELVGLPKAIMMDYESEEAFLSALKVLQKNLVR